MREGEEEEEEEVSSAAEPGASRHGNFVNYYQFHSAEERVRQLPQGLVDVAASHEGERYAALDIGCNAGDLTIELLTYLEQRLPGKKVSILGVDLDATLVERARAKNPRPDAISFECLDFLEIDRRRSLVESYLARLGLSRFSVSFCFSVTMWVHLNAGDEGLERLLHELCECSDALLLEPQPWRCYRQAARRLRRAGLPDFPLLPKLRYRGDEALEQLMQRVLHEECGFHRLEVTACNDWQRRLLLYVRSPPRP